MLLFFREPLTGHFVVLVLDPPAALEVELTRHDAAMARTSLWDAEKDCPCLLAVSSRRALEHSQMRVDEQTRGIALARLMDTEAMDLKGYVAVRIAREDSRDDADDVGATHHRQHKALVRLSPHWFERGAIGHVLNPHLRLLDGLRADRRL